MGHELLGVELIRKPLGALSAAQADLGSALTALLLSPTCFACSPISPRGHPAGDPQGRRLKCHAEYEVAMRL